MRHHRTPDSGAVYGVVPRISKGEDKISKKSDSYYFQNFIECVECGCQAAKTLEGNLNRFDTGPLRDKLGELHRIKHDADRKKHKTTAALVRAFITPIEWEDIIPLSQSIDGVADKIGDALIRIYINDVQQIHPKALAFIKVIIRCCEVLKEIMGEFVDFRESKTLHDLIVEISALEGEGDRLFIESMRRLHAEVTDSIKIIVWGEIYVYLEECCDACEHAADVVESVIMKNTRCPVLSEQLWSVYIRIEAEREKAPRTVGSGTFLWVGFYGVVFWLIDTTFYMHQLLEKVLYLGDSGTVFQSILAEYFVQT